MVRGGIGRVLAENAADAAFKIVQRNRVARLFQHEPDALLRLQRSHEQMAGFGDLHVPQRRTPNASGSPSKWGRRPARALREVSGSTGGHWLASRTVSAAKARSVSPIVDWTRYKRLLGAIYLDQMGSSRRRCAPEDGRCPARSRPQQAIPLRSAHRCRQGERCHRTHPARCRGRWSGRPGRPGRAVRGQSTGRCSPGLALVQILSDQPLGLRIAGDANHALDRDPLTLMSGRDASSQSLSKVWAPSRRFRAVRTKLMKRLYHLHKPRPADPSDIEQLVAGERRHRAHGWQIGLGQRSSQRLGQWQLFDRLGRVHQIGHERRLGAQPRSRRCRRKRPGRAGPPES